MLTCCFNFFNRLALAFVLLSISLYTLSQSYNNLQGIQLLSSFLDQHNLKIELLEKFNREIMYSIHLCGIYSAILCIFRGKLTKIFASIYLLVTFSSYLILAIYPNLDKNLETDEIANKRYGLDRNFAYSSVIISLLGGILSI